MKLIQKILSHGLLIAFVVVAFFAYTKRAELFPQWFSQSGKVQQQAVNEDTRESAPAPADRKVSRPLPEKTLLKKPVAPRGETTRGVTGETTGEPVPAAEGEQATPPTNEVEGVDVAEPAVEPLTAADAPAPGTTADSAGPDRQVPTDAAGGAETPVENIESQPAQSQAVPVVPDSAVTIPQAAPTTDAQLEKQLEQARQHYWRRDLRGATAAYQALAEAYPQNPDVWGEMGNFYFNLRQRKPAGAAYARCIELLIEQGEDVRARQLLNVLYRLDALKARELETRIQQQAGG